MDSEEGVASEVGHTDQDVDDKATCMADQGTRVYEVFIVASLEETLDFPDAINKYYTRNKLAESDEVESYWDHNLQERPWWHFFYQVPRSEDNHTRCVGRPANNIED